MADKNKKGAPMPENEGVHEGDDDKGGDED